MAPLSISNTTYDPFSHDPHALNEQFTYSLKISGEGSNHGEHVRRTLGPIAEAAPTKSRRRVRFNREKHCLSPVDPYYTDEDVEAKWWTSDELHGIKADAKHMSSELRRSRGPREGCEVTMAHRKTSLMLAGDFKSLMRLTPTSPDQDLQEWCSYDDGRRGLERFSSRDYSCFRKRDIVNTRTSVLDEQAMQAQSGIRDEEAIARISREASRRERTLAVFLGEADAKQASDSNEKKVPPPRRCPPPRKRSRMETPEFQILATAVAAA